MNTLKTKVEEELKRIFEEERSDRVNFPCEKDWLEPLEKFVLGPGKRLRPLSLLSFYIGAGGDLENRKDVLRAACAMELLHDSTLVHDDVMDEDELRRNSPTIAKTYYDKYLEMNNGDVKTEKFLFISRGTNYASSVAILLGNILYSMSQKLCLECGNKIGQIQLKLFNGLNYGQILDMRGLKTEEEYKINVLFKTAIFFQVTSEIGLLLAGRDENDIKIGHIWGEHFGVAFQERDDLLDIDPNGGKLRKLGSDIKEGKKTAVIWAALKEGVLSKEDKEFVEEITSLNEKAFDDEEKFNKFLNILRGKPSEYTRQQIKEHHKKAIEALEQLKLKEECFNFLKELTDLLLH